ncbi:MAG: hypothetical protein HXN34_02955 [Prevotella histicola]|nr:hypothetical protein [Prevotella histicola]
MCCSPALVELMVSTSGADAQHQSCLAFNTFRYATDVIAVYNQKDVETPKV